MGEGEEGRAAVASASRRLAGFTNGGHSDTTQAAAPSAACSCLPATARLLCWRFIRRRPRAAGGADPRSALLGEDAHLVENAHACRGPALDGQLPQCRHNGLGALALCTGRRGRVAWLSRKRRRRSRHTKKRCLPLCRRRNTPLSASQHGPAGRTPPGRPIALPEHACRTHSSTTGSLSADRRLRACACARTLHHLADGPHIGVGGLPLQAQLLGSFRRQPLLLLGLQGSPGLVPRNERVRRAHASKAQMAQPRAATA